MEKQFLVIIDNIPSLKIILSINNTISSIKKYFNSYPNYKISFFVNSSFELKTFDTDKYDLWDLRSVWDKIDDGFIYLDKILFKLPKDIKEKTITKFRSEKSYNSYNTSDLKSWLQKSIRRVKPEEAIWTSVELYTLPEQRIVTNLFNRIRIIAMEDIGVANPLIVKKVYDTLEKLEINGKPKLPVTEEDIIKIGELVSYMARSKHLRMASDYKAVFMTPKIRNKLIDLFPEIYKNHGKYINEKTKNVIFLGEKMVKLLIEKNDSAFYIMSSILDMGKLSFKTYRSNHPAYYILSLIGDLSKKLKVKFSPETDILVKWLKGGIINSKIDYNLPIYYAMLIILKRDELKEPETKMEKIEIKNFISNRVILKIPDYALDKHTLTGLRKGKTAIDFAKEGAYVENESDLLNKEYRKVYLETKNIKPDIPKLNNGIKNLESEIFDFDVRVQATVTDYRQDTYLATEKKTGRFVFVKGPYKTEEEVNIPIKLSEMKTVIAPNLPNIKLEKIKLIPDLFPNLPWGIRRHLDRNKEYWFLISESLIKKPVPRKIHNTKKWGDVEVIDYSKIDEPKKPDILKLKENELYSYILNLLFRYALGIPDIADRNFMLMKDGRVFSTDEEGFNKNINIRNKIGAKKAEFILENIEKEWDKIEKDIDDWLKNSVKLELEWIVKKLKEMKNLKYIKTIFE